MKNEIFAFDSYLFEFNIKDQNCYHILNEKLENKNIIMLGEATHGSLEFYTIRSNLSKYLIEKRGFDAVCIEGDWPDAALIDSYINGQGNPKTPELALSEFKRFPQWMWKNEVILDLVSWMRSYNDNNEHKAHVYGLDMYSLENSINAVINYLKKNDPNSVKEALKNYSGFNNIANTPQEYGALIKYEDKTPSTEQVLDEVNFLQEKYHKEINRDPHESDEIFFAVQNANLIKSAEHYYRAMYEYNENTWNIRDQHMFETLNNIKVHLEKKLQRVPKIIIWAHNSHIGNAKGTDMSKHGELNIGQLVKETYPKDSFSLGFSTYTGTVTAANNWNENPQYKHINLALPNSYEFLFHTLPFKNFLIDFQVNPEIKKFFSEPKLQRAIGVVYKPETELISHYYNARPSEQFDALIHIDYTNAIKPL